jgi:hypothetical protein
MLFRLQIHNNNNDLYQTHYSVNINIISKNQNSPLQFYLLYISINFRCIYGIYNYYVQYVHY